MTDINNDHRNVGGLGGFNFAFKTISNVQIMFSG